tara:strand:- start:41 stop:610 length:570 start_codon:yes stop_codon:yes gene_type:complete
MINATLRQDHKSETKIIASSGLLQIELINYVGTNDYKALIKISKSLAEEYGKNALLTPNTIQTYFNRKGSLPFIARFRNEIIGYIIGIPIEILNKEPWALLDKNFKNKNTIYTYAFVIEKEYSQNGYAKMLKRVYLNWAKKQDGIKYVTGHVKEGVSSKFKGNITIVTHVKNWQGTGKVFEYYRRELSK